MHKPVIFISLVIIAVAFIVSCSKKEDEPIQQLYPAIEAEFGDKIDLNSLANYANQPRPGYINKDNTGMMQKLLPLELKIFRETEQKFDSWRQGGLNSVKLQEYYLWLDQLVRSEYERIFGLTEK